MKSSKNIKTIEKVSKLCESALIGVNAYDMTAQSLAGLYEEAQKERDKEITQYILCVIHGDSSYPNEHLRKGLEYLKDELPNVKKYFQDLNDKCDKIIKEQKDTKK